MKNMFLCFCVGVCVCVLLWLLVCFTKILWCFTSIVVFLFYQGFVVVLLGFLFVFYQGFVVFSFLVGIFTFY